MIEIKFANEQTALAVDEPLIEAAIRAVLQQEGPAEAAVSVAVVDDARIHELNRRYLQHDYPTDVLSFVLEQSAQSLDGEIIVSAEMARSQAAHYGWTAGEELLLYVIHGTLHLVGYDDQIPDEARRMRAAESRYLKQLGVAPPTDVARGAADSVEGGKLR